MLFQPNFEFFSKLTTNLIQGPLRRRCLATQVTASNQFWQAETLDRLPFLSVAALPELHRVLTDWMAEVGVPRPVRTVGAEHAHHLFHSAQLFGCLACADPVWMGAAENLLNHYAVDPVFLPEDERPALIGFLWCDQTRSTPGDAWSLAPWSDYHLPVTQLLQEHDVTLYTPEKRALWRVESDALLGGLVPCLPGLQVGNHVHRAAFHHGTRVVYVGVLFGLISSWLELSQLHQSPEASSLEARWFVLREHLRNTLSVRDHSADRGFWSIAWMLVHELALEVLRLANGFLDHASQQLLLYLRPMLAHLNLLSPALKSDVMPVHRLLATVDEPVTPLAPAPEQPVKTALAGLKILDFTRLYPGPTATMMLAELGADVIRVEDPRRPDGMRLYPPFVDGEAAGYLAVNRGKRSLALDLSRPESRAVLQRLVAQVDVVIEGFKPGTMARFGMAWAQLKTHFPRLVYLSLSGYGQDGPAADKAGHDINYLAYSGFLGLNRDAAGVPVMPGGQIADIAGGAYLAAFGVLAGVAARDRHGRGQWVDLAMLDGVMPLLGLQLAHHWAGPAQGQKGFLSGALACYRVYRCADDRYAALGALEPKFWRAFCQWAEQPGWLADQFAEGAAQEQLIEAVTTFFARRPLADWIDRAAHENFCLAPVRDLKELADCPMLKARGMIATQKTAAGTPVLGVASPLKLSMTPATVGGIAPEVGRDSHGVLVEMGFSSTEIESLVAEGVLYCPPPDEASVGTSF
ncbi:CaiB/BaiF CoA transferase family protein [Acanthopleuribacter pedis]|uniref:CoA transferase n=1 Tax=Acanthopleuribacter pedis TaxID=442870 RepID=A0A8J7U4B9_9BACT|nr:CaiB/BaiF CoA-transferase family protein [Acanthopleuribacter pedis]MBO1319649.1 CoA transferase [Acanthopleuribacter pedis]